MCAGLVVKTVCFSFFFLLLQCLLFWVRKVSGTRSESLWEFNFKFIKQVKGFSKINSSYTAANTLCYSCCHNYLCVFQPRHSKNDCAKSLRMPRQYEDVHWNPDSDCYMLQVTTLNYILTPVVMGMTLSLVSNF